MSSGRGEYLRWRASGSDTPSTILRLIHIVEDKPEIKEELISLIGNKGLDLIQDVHISWYSAQRSSETTDDVEKSDALCFVRFKTRSGIFAHHALSAGTRRILRILVSILYDASQLLMLEHPEDTIHCGLLQPLMDIVREYSSTSQFIVASHSPYIIDGCEPEELRIVSMDAAGHTKVNALRPDEIEAAKDYVCTQAPLSEFLPLTEEV